MATATSSLSAVGSAASAGPPDEAVLFLSNPLKFTRTEWQTWALQHMYKTFPAKLDEREVISFLVAYKHDPTSPGELHEVPQDKEKDADVPARDAADSGVCTVPHRALDRHEPVAVHAAQGRVGCLLGQQARDRDCLGRVTLVGCCRHAQCVCAQDAKAASGRVPAVCDPGRRGGGAVRAQARDLPDGACRGDKRRARQRLCRVAACVGSRHPPHARDCTAGARTALRAAHTLRARAEQGHGEACRLWRPAKQPRLQHPVGSAGVHVCPGSPPKGRGAAHRPVQ